VSPDPAPEPAKVAAAKPGPHPPKAASGTEGWVVQLGSFASRENGEKLATSLRGKGYRAFVSEFRGSGRILYRVRVGPEQDRSRAESIAARLGRDGYKGSVAPH
jgi:DedD protein